MIIEKIFGKTINLIDKNDLNTIMDVPETFSVEYKSVPDIDPTLNSSEQKKRKNKILESMLKSVVAFLNSNNSGLLVLGIKTKDEVPYKIEGGKKEVITQLKSEISLEGFFKEKVNAIPSYLHKFEVETKIVEYNEERTVIFIEVLNNNWDRIYYSDISQYVYIRNGQSSNKISFVDTLKLIAERSYPKFMQFRRKPKWN